MKDCRKHQCKRKVKIDTVSFCFDGFWNIDYWNIYLYLWDEGSKLWLSLNSFLYSNLIEIIHDRRSFKKTWFHFSLQCCDGNCVPCDQQCSKTLGCKNHKCSSRCHQGPCYPCPLTETISCACKETYTTVPCGKHKTTRPPRCNKPCKYVN